MALIKCEWSQEGLEAVKQLAQTGVDVHNPNINRTDIIEKMRMQPKELLMQVVDDINRIQQANNDIKGE